MQLKVILSHWAKPARYFYTALLLKANRYVTTLTLRDTMRQYYG